jgi:hypothetical protein
MAINIKELFRSDLDPNGTLWWSEDKIDKVNYNFGLLSNGGMPGPQGSIGPDGDFGPIGMRGPQGYQGFQGPRGLQGDYAINDWVYYADTISSTGYLFVKKNIDSTLEYSPVVMRIGIDKNDSRYTVPSSYYDYVVLGNVNPNLLDTKSPKINLRLQSDGKFSDYKLTKNGNIDELHIGKFVSGESGFEIIYPAENLKLRSITTQNGNATDTHEISDSLIKINSRPAQNGAATATATLSNVSGKHARSNHTFNYSKGSQIDYVLVSDDSLGTSNWRDKNSLFGSYPIGSIISIRESDFNSTNFHLNGTEYQTGSPLPVLKNLFGRGKVNTDFAGWYLCNGESWEISPGVNSILTPNLNSFNYNIGANGGEQNAITNGGSNDKIIVGGYDLNVNASFNSVNNSYDVQFTNTWNDNNSGDATIDMGTSSPTDSYVSRMVHIVYLENTNLSWSKSNVAPPVIVTTPISLGYSLLNSPSPNGICDVQTSNNYSWNGTSGSWATFNESNGGVYLYSHNTTNFAPTGYYIDVATGVWRYWNATTQTFSSPTTCVVIPSFNIFLVSSDRVDQYINGPVSQFTIPIQFKINNSDFKFATTLKYGFNNADAVAGWYRDVATGRRRYWNGSSFQGVAFTNDYVYSVQDALGNHTGFNMITSVSNACGGSNTRYESYVATDNEMVSTDISNIIGLILWVPQNWIGLPGQPTPALVNIISQNAPSQTTTWKRVYHNGDFESVTASINQTTGVVNTPTLCDGVLSPSTGGTGTGTGGSGCLIEGTNILMNDETIRKIENLKIGDILSSKLIEGMPIKEDQTLLDWRNSEDIKLQKESVELKNIKLFEVDTVLSFNNKTIVSSKDHLHVVKQDGIWRILRGDAIKIGDYLLDQNGGEIEVEIIDIFRGNFKVYKLDVEENDLFIANGILTHNLKTIDAIDAQ